MRKYVIILIAAAAVTFLYTGCSEFDSLPLNIPISVPLHMSGSNNPVAQSKFFCLSDYDNYEQYAADINKITYLQAAFRVDSVSQTSLQGDISAEVKNGSGQVLFSFTLTNVKPSTYMTTPYIIPLTAQQIQAINAYVANLENKCFTVNASLTVTNGTQPYYVGGIVDFVFEAETNL